MFTFEKNIPIPAPPQRIQIDGLKVGESFLIADEKTKERVRARAVRLGFEVIFRKTGTAGWRCWRTK